MKETYLTVQGIKTYLKDEGQGQVVLFLHGNPDSSAMWDGIIERLPKSGFRYIAADLPGFGKTGSAKNFDWSLENRAKWLANLLDALSIKEPVILVSHDIGVHFAGAFAAQHPERIKKLVLQNSFFHSDYKWHFLGRVWRTPVLGELMNLMPQSKLTLWVAQWYMKKGSPLLTDAYIADLQKSWTDNMGQAVLAAYRASTPSVFAGWEDKLNKFIAEKPTLILWGDKDYYIAPDFAEKWRKAGAKVLRFAEAGHWLAIEKPAEYANALEEFIQN